MVKSDLPEKSGNDHKELLLGFVLDGKARMVHLTQRKALGINGIKLPPAMDYIGYCNGNGFRMGGIWISRNCLLPKTVWGLCSGHGTSSRS